uniref:Uncharacterized protein n=1 Tax=viral metagenome TaxID=1070528 RepID=A0A2V0RK62_9ZZZZ
MGSVWSGSAAGVASGPYVAYVANVTNDRSYQLIVPEAMSARIASIDPADLYAASPSLGDTLSTERMRTALGNPASFANDTLAKAAALADPADGSPGMAFTPGTASN